MSHGPLLLQPHEGEARLSFIMYILKKIFFYM